MKRMIAMLAMAAGLASCSVMMRGSGDGISVGAGVNISAQPPWGPAGYECAPYYYFPDFNIYYDVNRALFYYLERGRWISVRVLPPHAGPRDLYRYYKVVLDVRDPWRYNRTHRVKYKQYRGVYNQPVLRDTPGYKYRPAPAPTPYRGNSGNNGNGNIGSNRNTMRNNYAQPATGQGTRTNTATPPKQQKPKPEKVKPQQNSRSNGNASAEKRSTGSRGR